MCGGKSLSGRVHVCTVSVCFVEGIIGETGPTDCLSVYVKYINTITQFRSIATAVSLITALKNTLIFLITVCCTDSMTYVYSGCLWKALNWKQMLGYTNIPPKAVSHLKHKAS